MNIPDAAVEAAARAFDAAYGVPYWSASAKNTARAILMAAAPHIAAHTLVEASGLVMDVDESPADSPTCQHIAEQLRIRAESLKHANPYRSAGAGE